MKQVIVAALLGVASCATPAKRPPPIAPALETLAFYVGTWNCKGTSFEKNERWEAQVIVTPELDGSWLSVKMIGPGENRTVEHKGWDPATKKWVHIAVASEGWWGTLRSDGWVGAQMRFIPDDKADDTLATFTKLDERRYSHGVTRGDEKLWEKVCTKS